MIKKLGELFKVKHGFAFKGEFFSAEGPYILLTPGNFQPSGGLKLKGDKEKYYTGSVPDDFILKRGDLVLAMTDLTQKAPILGSAAVIPESGRFLHNQRLGKVIDLASEVTPEFLYYLLNTEMVRQQLRGSASGATVRHTSPERIYAVEVGLPPREVQVRVVATLKPYDELIENNLRRIEILEEMAQTIHREWFVNFRFPGHEDVDLTDSSIGSVPSKWAVLPTQDAFEVTGGGTPSTKKPDFWDGGNINWFTPSDLTGHGHMFIDRSQRQITEAGLEGSSAKLFPPGCVMMTSRATLGVLAINTIEACTNQGFITCIPNDRVAAPYLFFWLRENTGQIINRASGATFKEISKGVFKQIDFLIPSQETMQEFVRRVDPMLDLLSNLSTQVHNLRTTRDLLLPKLISGEIDISELDIDTSFIAA